jgi:hypothetical protein
VFVDPFLGEFEANAAVVDESDGLFEANLSQD